MEKGQDTCPSCGAQVFPEEAKCPVCSHHLHARRGARLLVGAAGTVLALVAGAGVWWLLAVPAPPQVEPVPQQAVEAQPAVTSAPATPASTTPASTTPAPAPAMPPPPAWPANGARDQPAELPPEVEAATPPAPAPATAAGPAVSVTAEERRAFAKESEANLTSNGLQLTVSTSGEEDTTLVMTFAYPATTTAELIVAGPFPRQCERRGFTRILFIDPGEVTLVYDIATQTLSKR